MANLTVHKNEGQSGRAELEPFRAMRRLLDWDPFREMVPFSWPEERGVSFSPAFEVKETKGSYFFKADVPGIAEKDLDITLTGNRLTVSGKREAEKEDQGETYYAYERSYGRFTRSFTLPEGADAEQIKADMKDGVLTLTVPKRPEVMPKKISLKSILGKA